LGDEYRGCKNAGCLYNGGICVKGSYCGSQNAGCL
jgi:hypothetical protein